MATTNNAEVGTPSLSEATASGDATSASTPSATTTATTTPAANTYQSANGTAHMLTGLIAGAAVAYLLTSKGAQQKVGVVAKDVWGSVRGEMEELKERLADAQAELAYYREQQKK